MAAGAAYGNKPPKGKGPKGKPKPKGQPGAGPRASQRGSAETLAASQAAAFQRYLTMLEGYIGQLGAGPSPADMLRQAKGLYPQIQGGPNYTRGQLRGFARQDVSAIMNPLLANIRETYGDRSKAMADAYGYYYKQTGPQLAQYAQNLQGVQSQALASQGAADQALAAYLQQAGGQVAADIGGQLQAINAPAGTLAESAGNLGGLAGGSAGQTYALGSAAMDQARAQAQSANTIAAALPISQQKYGAEQLLARQAQLNTEMGEDLGALEARIPELTTSIFGQYRDERSQNAQLKAARANALMGFLGNAYTQDFNRDTAVSAILRDLVTATGGMAGDAASLAASLIPGGPGGFTPPAPGSGGGTTAKDNQAARQQLNENVASLPLFQPSARSLIESQSGNLTGPSRAQKNPYQAFKAVMGQIGVLFPKMPQPQRRRLAASVLQGYGIPFRDKPWKKPQQPAAPTTEDIGSVMDPTQPGYWP